MILLVGLLLGFVAGYVRAWLLKRPYTLPTIQRVELALLAFLPQGFVFFVPQTGRFVSQQWAAIILPVSLGILVLFVWYNRRVRGFWLLGLGLLLNLAVIVANGGLMPISPETLITVHGEQAAELTDSRAYGSKSIVLPADETRLEWLADRFTLPDWTPLQFAFSLGDVFLAVGAFWVLWAGGAPGGDATASRRREGITENVLYS
ncbi:MAG TPA: DUF5317 domain-containing protein [Caldilineaceae bacterium]|nr:DUF5317 domain-containing protein [Caldilineaceae bacterium]